MKNIFLSTPILDELIKYTTDPKIPFHMPAHCGGRGIDNKILDFFGENIFKADLTELDELDNFHEPDGIIKEAQDKIAKIFNARSSYMLINGSTAGLMALTMISAREGDKILINRNCHRSIINGLILSGAEPVWYMPEWLDEWQLFGPVQPEIIDHQLENNPDIKAVFITNPTYEGVVSDTKAIAALCKKYGVNLFVDEAHGGHWKFHPELPLDAISSGADACVQSFHKTCGSLSQSSILHVSKKSNLNQTDLHETLKLLQSTSPSYLLMASLDAASSYINSDEGKKNLDRIYQLSLELRNKLKTVNNLDVLSSQEGFIIDPTRLFIKIDKLSGETLAETIEDNYHIAIESLNNTGNLFFLNTGNTKENIDRLYECILKIASEPHNEEKNFLQRPILPKLKMNPGKAFMSQSEKIQIKDAIKRIVKYPVVKCPPGICILIPGEEIAEYHLQFFNKENKITVVKE